jgi:tyrosine-protein kinase Etk/Wzc
VAGITAIAVASAWFTGRRAVPQYRSSATIQVTSKKQIFARLDDIDVEEMSLRTDPVLSEVLVLSTQSLALDVADALGLRLQFTDPQVRRNEHVADVLVDSLAVPDTFALRLDGPRGYALRDGRGRMIASGGYDVPVVGPGFTFVVLPYDGDPVTLRLAVLPRVSAAGLVRGGIGYSVQPNTNVVTVTHTGADPSQVPAILDGALRSLQQFGAERIREVANNRLRYITERVTDAHQRYMASLARVQDFQTRNSTTDISAEETALINSIQEFEREKTRRELDLATVRSIMGGGTDVTVETVNRLAAVAAIATNPAMAFQLENLLKLYDDRRTLVAGQMGLREGNPQIQALDQRIAQASRTLLDAANTTVRSMEAAITQLDGNIRELRERLSAYPGRQGQFAQLALDADLQSDTYKYLLAQQEAARILAATITPYIQVVEPGSPAGRIGMGLRQKLVIGLFVGLFLGVLGAFLLEYLDQTIKTSADIERALEVPVLGMIPMEKRPAAVNANGRRRGNLPLVSAMAADSPASEAYRTLRTNVTFVHAEQRQLKLIVVTSPGPGEGKSTTAANLAITLAQQGAPTLLVDADLRRPLVHRAFNLVQAPGLTDVLVGTAQLREAIRPNVVPKLDVLPAGALPPNPSELLGSDAMRELLDQVRGQYETIIFDSPPTLAVTDATVLGAEADAVILVVRAGETEEVAAQRAVAQLKRVQAKVAGTVLNGLQKRRDRYYNYYTYYRGERRSDHGLLEMIRDRISNVL